MIALCLSLIILVSALEEGYVITPFGRYLCALLPYLIGIRRKECVLEVPDNARVAQVGSRLEITETVNGMS